MALLTGPYASFQARGKLGGRIITQRRYGRNIAKQFAIPANPNTIGQQLDREHMRIAVKGWQAYLQDSSALEAWSRYADSRPGSRTGYNDTISQIKYSLIAQPNPAFHYGPLAKYGRLYTLPMIDVATGGVATEPEMFDVFVGSKPNNLQYHTCGLLSAGILYFWDTPGPPVNQGLLLQLDGSHIMAYSPGVEMTIWPDTSPGGHNYAREVAGKGCHYQIDPETGLGCAYFDGVADYMRCPSWIQDLQEIDIFTAFRYQPTVAHGHFLAEANNNVPQSHVRFNAIRPPTYEAASTLVQGGVLVSTVCSPPITPNVTAHTRFSMDATGGIAETNTVHGALDPAFYPIPIQGGILYSTLGRANSDATNGPYEGHMMELLVYDRKLTDAQAASVSAYLMHKWHVGNLGTLPVTWNYLQVQKNGYKRSGVIKL